MDESKPKHFSITIDGDDMEKGVIELAKLVKPHWDPEKFVLKVCIAENSCVKRVRSI